MHGDRFHDLEEARAQRRAYELQRGDQIARRERAMADVDQANAQIGKLAAFLVDIDRRIDRLLDEFGTVP
jgi:hypothetical protein